MMTTLNLTITDMTCASCVQHIETDVKKIEGVHMVSVNFATQEASVHFDAEKTSPDEIIATIQKTGYTAFLNDAQDGGTNNGEHHSEHGEHGEHHDHAAAESAKEIQSKMWKVVFGTLASLLLTALGFWIDIPSEGVVMMLITLFILWYTGGEFFRKGIPALLKGRPQMDTLVVLGVSTAFLYSSYNVLFTSLHEEYFMDAAVISTFIMLGRYLEARAKGNASAAIKKLLSLGAKMAHRVIAGKKMEDVSIDEVQKDDFLLVKPGEKIPVDGVITDGVATIDESMVTGESVPADKEVGATVIGATINGNTSFTMKAQKVGKETMLAQIVKLVGEAQMNKPPIQKLVDTISSYFVWVVMGIALVSFLVWTSLSGSAAIALIPTVAVLIIACPCALGLATPISIVVGSGKGAEMGILLKRAESLEKMNKITAICFDKTGTITEGKLHVTEVVPYDVPLEAHDQFVVDGVSPTDKKAYEQKILQYVASIEHQSEHPLAAAVAGHAAGQSLSLLDAQDIQATPGQGLSGSVNGILVRIGSQKFLARQKVMRCAELDEEALKLQKQGKTVLFFSIDEKERGIIALQDQPKESSKEALELLHKQGIKTIMMTGDNATVAQNIAKEMGIDDVLAEVSPQDKVAKVKELQEAGEFVAMVGDGINDAPALATADVGIAMGTGTDVAIESGDIVIVKGDLLKAVEAIELSRATLRNIKQNLFWAFIYNAIGIPVAAFGFLNPIFSAGAMAFSSVSVVLNALRLKRFKTQL